MWRWIVLATALAGALLLAWSGVKTPRPRPADAPAEQFSAMRAAPLIKDMARTPHMVGSPANARVRDLLLARLRALGLEATVQTGAASESPKFGRGWILGGNVENVVGVLRGQDPKLPALLLMAHYDSVPASPGAADDAAGVASIMEILRVLHAKGTPTRDVVVLFSDGEEAGLLGARLFFREHPLRERIGLVINLESRGGGGRANMFETGSGNAALIRLFSSQASAPVSSSLAVFLYERMPNDTDFTVPKALGLPGLNFAFIGRQFDYHSPSSTFANLDLGSVQHMGDQALPMARALAYSSELPARTEDAVYSQTLGDHVLAYPSWVGWLILVMTAALVVAAGLQARAANGLSGREVLRGAGAGLLVALSGALVLQLARRATGYDVSFMGVRPLLAQWPQWEGVLALIAVGALLATAAMTVAPVKVRWPVLAILLLGLLCQLFGGWDPVGAVLAGLAAALAMAVYLKPARLAGSWLGLLGLGVAVECALQALAPAIAFMVAWPLALAAAAASVGALGQRRGVAFQALYLLVAVVGCGWLAVYFDGVAHGLDMAPTLAVFAWLAAPLIWPLAAIDTKGSWRVGAGLVAIGLIGAFGLRVADPWTPRHPQATSVFHVTDLTKGESWRVSTEARLAGWSRSALSRDRKAIERRTFPPLTRSPVAAAPARALKPPPAEISGALGGDGVYRATVRPPAGTRVLVLKLSSGATITDATVGGRPAPLLDKDHSPAMIRWTNPGEALDLTFRPAGAGAVTVAYAAIGEGWPEGAEPLPARPADVMAFDLSDSAVTIGEAKLTW